MISGPGGWGEVWEAECGWGGGGAEVLGFVIVVSQNMDAAAASSFALVLC